MEMGAMDIGPTLTDYFDDERLAQQLFAPKTIHSDFMSDVEGMSVRQWIVLNILLRGYVSAIFSPGGVGKSTLSLVLAISIALGRDLLGLRVIEQTNVLLINNEDDEDELRRRIAGILILFDIDPVDLEGKLFFYSGYGSPLTIAMRCDDRTVIASPDVELITKHIKVNGIGTLFIDPFISTHDIPENDNGDIDKVIQQYKVIAHETKVGIFLVHHTRKTGLDSEAHAGDAEIGRGASSLKDAARSICTLARMSGKTAERLGLESDEAQRYVRMDNGKNNFGISDGEAAWFRMESVKLPNGDSVGVPRPVNLKPLFESSRSDKGKKWSPTSVAEALERVMRKRSSVQWTEVRQKFMDDNEIKKSQADDVRTLLSDSKAEATRINVSGMYIEYWTEKAHPTAPVFIHRQEISD